VFLELFVIREDRPRSAR